MPQALKPLSLIHIGRWENSPFPLLALWGNENGLPSMKEKNLENFQNKIGLKGCKCSSLNAQCTVTPQSHPYWELGEFPFPNLDDTEGFQCLGHSNWTICSPLSPFCSENFPTFSLSYWGAHSYYPRGLIGLIVSAQLVSAQLVSSGLSAAIRRSFFSSRVSSQLFALCLTLTLQ